MKEGVRGSLWDGTTDGDRGEMLSLVVKAQTLDPVEILSTFTSGGRDINLF